MRYLMTGAMAPVMALMLAGAAYAEPVKASAKAGVVVGETADGVASWKGIPFAAAPVGDLRWKAPQPVAAWTSERAATEFGASCTQTSRLGAEAKVAEDCLYLNVWAPEAATKKGAKKLPVMVWIHGGSNMNGSGAIYNGVPFAKSGVVFVSINYRMGPLGFYAHPAITAAAAPGEPLANYGLMDQTAALKWVQDNIGAFGGDKKKVTVFGESAGAIDIYALLGLKSSKGLFSKAILESNITWGDSAPLSAAEKAGAGLATKAGASETATLAELKAIPAEKLVAAQDGALFPIVDGRFMTETSLQAVARKHVVDVPLIVGTNSFEASLVQARMPKDTWQGWTDAQANAPARFIADKTAGGKPTWLYHFSYVPAARREGSNGAVHAAEIPYVFNGSNRNPPPAGYAPTAEDTAIANVMHACWVAFAKTGKPTCNTTAKWPAYSAKIDQLYEFGATSGVRTNFRKAELDAATAKEPAVAAAIAVSGK